MSITLTKEGRRKFYMTCATCDAEYEYTLEDLGDIPTNTSFVICPCCDMANYHYQRNRVKEEMEQKGKLSDVVNILEDEICKLCSESTKCDGGTCGMSRRMAWELVHNGWRKQQ